jgi:hypothetical protein
VGHGAEREGRLGLDAAAAGPRELGGDLLGLLVVLLSVHLALQGRGDLGVLNGIRALAAHWPGASAAGLSHT